MAIGCGAMALVIGVIVIASLWPTGGVRDSSEPAAGGAPGAVDLASPLLFLLLLAIGGVVYFLPSIVASRRRHPKQSSIGVVNFFLGWTLVGWVVALAWAVSEPERGARQ